MRIGNHGVLTFHTNPQTGMCTALLHTGMEWVTATVPKSFGPAPAEWWQGHYHGDSYDDALQDFLRWSELAQITVELAR